MEARFQMGMMYFEGKIVKQNDDDGTYDIRYADGDAEQRVAPALIRKVRENDFDGVFWNRVDDIFRAIGTTDNRGGGGGGGVKAVTGAEFAQYCSPLGDPDGPKDAGAGATTRRLWAQFRATQPGGDNPKAATDKDGFRMFFHFAAAGGGGGRSAASSSSTTEAPELNERCQQVCRFLSQGVDRNDKAQNEFMPGSRVEARYVACMHAHACMPAHAMCARCACVCVCVCSGACVRACAHVWK